METKEDKVIIGMTHIIAKKLDLSTMEAVALVANSETAERIMSNPNSAGSIEEEAENLIQELNGK